MEKALYLAGLNPEQEQAVLQTEHPLLVLSGAGTGKTRVLTSRLAHIICSGLAQPWQCLAVTFTNKAAREMESRLAALIGVSASSVWLGTFHRFGCYSRGERSLLLPLEPRPDYLGESGMGSRDPCRPCRGKLGPGHKPR